MPRRSSGSRVSAGDILRTAARRVADPDDDHYGHPYEAVCETAEDLTGEWSRSSTPLANLAAAVAAENGQPEPMMDIIFERAETVHPDDLAARMTEVAELGG